MKEISFKSFKIPQSVESFIISNPNYLKKWMKKYDDPSEAYFSGRVNEDWNSISAILSKNTYQILDIGCGVAGMTLTLAKNFPEAQLTLIEQAERKQENGTFHLLDIAKELLMSNDIHESRCEFLDSHGDKYNHLNKKFDLIISLRALAYSFPYTIYENWINEHLQTGGKLIFDAATWETENQAVTEMNQDPVMQNRFNLEKPSSSQLIEKLSQTLGPVEILRRGADSVRVCATKK